MQGTAADIITLAMIAVDDWCRREAPEAARLIMQVHDELVLEVRQDAVERVAGAVRSLMAAAGADELRVPLRIEVGTGANWDEAH
jgi:DNA polymerase-1